MAGLASDGKPHVEEQAIVAACALAGSIELVVRRVLKAQSEVLFRIGPALAERIPVKFPDDAIALHVRSQT